MWTKKTAEKFAGKMKEIACNVDCGERELFALLNAIDEICKEITEGKV
jgi:hypothetical protein